MRIILTLLILSVLSVGTASAAPFAYVSNFGSSNVSVIDVSTNTVVDTVDVDPFPFGVAASPDGAFVYVANSASDSVSVISTFDNRVVDTVDVGGDPVGVAVTPDSRKVFVVNHDDSSVSVISTFDNNTVVDTVLTLGFHPLFVDTTLLLEDKEMEAAAAQAPWHHPKPPMLLFWCIS